ncbi:orotidine 5'-phosphate decarboxylase [Candidatus Daviesbacteria bacterium]|nr:orotidine 5'-phosphate decarboxylase [Candidatus Daviesbacteria bacterium]
MAERLVPADKSIIVACDVASIHEFDRLLQETAPVLGISAYKIGFELALQYGLPSLIQHVKFHSNAKIIYDHQKAGNDIPEIGVRFARVCAESKVDEVILFPFAGPKTQEFWTKACQDKGLKVLTGGHMTHEGFSEDDGGYINAAAPYHIYLLATRLGVTDFVVPGNKPELVQLYLKYLQGCLNHDATAKSKITLYSPGFIKQGGEISEMAKVAGEKWHAIVGRAIYGAKDIRAAAELMTSQIK